MALEVQNKLFSLLGEVGCPGPPLLTPGSRSECIMRTGVANMQQKLQESKGLTNRAASAVLRLSALLHKTWTLQPDKTWF